MTVRAESGTQTVLGKKVNTVQSSISISGTSITGTLKYVDDYTEFSGDPELQSGHFLVLHWSDPDETATSLKVGVVPSSIGAEPVECLSDTDRNGVFRITDKNTQKIHIITSDGENELTQIFDLRDLTLEAPEDQGEG